MLADESAWSSLDEQTKRTLYDLFPQGHNNVPFEVDVNVHPMRSPFSKYVRHFVWEWEQDLAAGRNTAKWQREAKQATFARMAGRWEEGSRAEREEAWGPAPHSGFPGVEAVEAAEAEEREKSVPVGGGVLDPLEESA